jgi:hypothetical protein
MADDLPVSKRAKFLNEVAEMKSEAERVESLGRAIASEGRSMRDLADIVEGLVQSAPDDTEEFADLDRLTVSFRSATQAYKAFSPSFTLLTASGSTAASTAMSEVFLMEPATAWNPPAIEAAKDRLTGLRKHPELMAELRAGMQRLGLDTSSNGIKSPADSLADAEMALRLPVVGEASPTATLIPFRECIDAIFSLLIPRRPDQEPAHGWNGKLGSIARQCGQHGVGDDVIERLVEEAGMLKGQLSGAKQRDLSRREVSHLFYRSAWFLKAFLTLIDEQKLRPIK